eukprot:gene2058-18236_t
MLLANSRAMLGQRSYLTNSRVPAAPLHAKLSPRPAGSRVVTASARKVDTQSFMSFDDAPEDREEVFQTESGLVESVSEDTAEVDFLGESTMGSLHLERANVVADLNKGIVGALGMSSLNEIIDMPIQKLKDTTQLYLDALRVPENLPEGNPQRAIYCSRTLNMASIKAIGYDMDYTLIHYDVNAWEGRAYECGLEALRVLGVPVDGLKFDPDLVTRGLIMDKEHGNLIKVSL